MSDALPSYDIGDGFTRTPVFCVHCPDVNRPDPAYHPHGGIHDGPIHADPDPLSRSDVSVSEPPKDLDLSGPSEEAP